MAPSLAHRFICCRMSRMDVGCNVCACACACALPTGTFLGKWKAEGCTRATQVVRSMCGCSTRKAGTGLTCLPILSTLLYSTPITPTGRRALIDLAKSSSSSMRSTFIYSILEYICSYVERIHVALTQGRI